MKVNYRQLYVLLVYVSDRVLHIIVLELASVVGSKLDLCREFLLLFYCVTYLQRLLLIKRLHTCASVTKQYNLVPANWQ